MRAKLTEFRGTHEQPTEPNNDGFWYKGMNNRTRSRAWDGEQIVEVTNDSGRTYRVALRPNGKHEVWRVIFGTLDNDLTPAERRAAIALTQSRSFG